MSQEMMLQIYKLGIGVLSFSTLTFFFRSLSQREGKTETCEEIKESTWSGLDKLEIIEIIQETPDIKTFRLRLDKKSIPKFSPGQFLSFQIGNNKKIFRSYSISSSNENNSLIQVSIKKITDGIGSTWFHSLEVGDEVFAYPPSGHFSDENLKGCARVFVAGGIGITPLYSMVLSALDSGKKHPMTLFFAARRKVDLAFHNELQALSLRYENLNYIPILSNEVAECWGGLSGKLDIDILKTYVPNVNESHFYFCGPPPLTDSISKELLNLGVSRKQLHSEKFVSPTTISEDDITHKDVNIKLGKQEFKYSGKQNLLEFFEGQNEEIPFACRSGVCGACKLKRTSGEVLSLTDSGLKDEEKEDYILSCVSWPQDNLTLERP